MDLTGEAQKAPLPPPSKAISVEGFCEEELRRLEIQRRHGFRATDCGQDLAYPGTRQTADFHLRHLMCKALQLAAWSIDDAAGLLAGAGEPANKRKLRGRIETFLQNLQRRRERFEREGAGEPGEARVRQAARFTQYGHRPRWASP